MPSNKALPIRVGGLMRCCLKTYNTEGDRLQCSYTDDPTHSLRVRDGAWEWNHG